MKNLFTIVLFLVATFSFGQSDKDMAQETVQQNTLKAHIYFLADDLLEGRGTGTKGNKIAASYLANSLRKYGIQPNPLTGDYYQKFSLSQTSQPESSLLKLAGSVVAEQVTLDGPAMEFSGSAVVAGYGLEEDYASINVTDKIVIVKAGKPEAANARTAYRSREEKKSSPGKMELRD
ncbi:hypothetical protein [Croceiramulus getboli]|nr:hypothetical protein P8624_09115 [Flavobacteriaceae bacterium YJPT1-3]